MMRMNPAIGRQLEPDLVYNIATRRLVGTVDGVRVSTYAGSGGRAQSTTGGATNMLLANNPLATWVKKPDGSPPSVSGGPLPLGKYFLEPHHRLGFIRLTPLDVSAMHGRDGMLIHGPGPRGSDGCIVPMDGHLVSTLRRLVDARERSNKMPYLLEVVATGQDLDRLTRIV